MTEIILNYCKLRLVWIAESNQWSVYADDTLVLLMHVNPVDLKDAQKLIKAGIKESDVEWLRKYEG